MARRFEGQVVFITGASSGIGAATARAFAREGARLALLARRADRLEAVKAEIESLGAQALVVLGDVTEAGSVANAVKTIVAHYGRVDIVLANAGFGVMGPAWKLNVEDYRRQFETNVFGVMRTVQAVLPELHKTRGRIGIVSSIMGRQGFPGFSAYCASKSALIGYVESLYYDLVNDGIAVTLIEPGVVASEIRSVNNNAEYTGQPEPLPAWMVVPAEKAAQEILDAIHRRRPEVILTGHGKLMCFITRHFPRTSRFCIRMAGKGRLKKMPTPHRES